MQLTKQGTQDGCGGSRYDRHVFFALTVHWSSCSRLLQRDVQHAAEYDLITSVCSSGKTFMHHKAATRSADSGFYSLTGPDMSTRTTISLNLRVITASEIHNKSLEN